MLKNESHLGPLIGESFNYFCQCCQFAEILVIIQKRSRARRLLLSIKAEVSCEKKTFSKFLPVNYPKGLKVLLFTSNLPGIIFLFNHVMYHAKVRDHV